MRRFLAILACATALAAGPCILDSWSLAIDPGIDDGASFIGVDLDFGNFDLVLPLVQTGN